ncbi:hypothetical protein [Paraburkholderia flava]|uniref:hypothetical protein n=1 Tax=Paraburkholderia flava TaxID=2547393 RepID=UPI00105F50C4|nr:hypothetical protein [Paraburkholderia flava]
MRSIRLSGYLLRFVFPVLASTFTTASALAASSGGGQPLILDTQKGISDGQSGTVLQTAPLSHARIVDAQPIATPTELAPNSSPPILVSPYIEVPAGGQSRTAPKPQLRLPTSPQ